MLIALRTTGPCRREKTVVSLLNFEQFLVLFLNDADFFVILYKEHIAVHWCSQGTLFLRKKAFTLKAMVSFIAIFLLYIKVEISCRLGGLLLHCLICCLNYSYLDS